MIQVQGKHGKWDIRPITSVWFSMSVWFSWLLLYSLETRTVRIRIDILVRAQYSSDCCCSLLMIYRCHLLFLCSRCEFARQNKLSHVSVQHMNQFLQTGIINCFCSTTRARIYDRRWQIQASPPPRHESSQNVGQHSDPRPYKSKPQGFVCRANFPSDTAHWKNRKEIVFMIIIVSHVYS